jgi:hypothetical protein
MLPWSGPRIYVAGAGKIFDASGRIVDDALRSELATFLQGFASFIARVETRV